MRALAAGLVVAGAVACGGTNLGTPCGSISGALSATFYNCRGVYYFDPNSPPKKAGLQIDNGISSDHTTVFHFYPYFNGDLQPGTYHLADLFAVYEYLILDGDTRDFRKPAHPSPGDVVLTVSSVQPLGVDASGNTFYAVKGAVHTVLFLDGDSSKAQVAIDLSF